jgi:hypothetical protein
MELVRFQPISLFLSVSYSGSVLPSFQRAARVRFPSRMLHVHVVQRSVPRSLTPVTRVRFPSWIPRLSRRCRTTVSTSVSRTDNTGSIPVTDTLRAAGAWLSNCIGSLSPQGTVFRAAAPRPSSQSVLGTATAHSCLRDGSIPSTATSCTPCRRSPTRKTTGSTPVRSTHGPVAVGTALSS